MLLKICGITNAEDLRFAVNAGADFAGIIIVPGSRRQVSLETAKTLIQEAASAKTVLVVRNMEQAQLQEAIDELHPYAVQLHGAEPPEYASTLKGAHIWKAFSLQSENDLRQYAEYPAEMLVADSGGGTGHACNWELAAKLARTRAIFLAGGMNPSNVREAMEKVRPAGIDVAGGVEKAPGIKDHSKIQSMIEAIKGKTGN